MSNDHGPSESPAQKRKLFEDNYPFGSVSGWSSRALNAFALAFSGNEAKFPEEGILGITFHGEEKKFRDTKGAFELVQMFSGNNIVAFRYNAAKNLFELYRGKEVVMAWPTTQAVDQVYEWLEPIAEAKGVPVNRRVVMFPWSKQGAAQPVPAEPEQPVPVQEGDPEVPHPDTPKPEEPSGKHRR
jgi:hypothetical protein